MADNTFSQFHDMMKDVSLKAMESSKPSGIFFGTVVSASPLRVQIMENMTLGDEFLVLSSLVQDFTVSMTVDHQTEAETEHTHAVHDTYTNGGSSDPTDHLHEYKGTKAFRVHLGLKAGEKVILLRVQGGQQFIVLDRVRG